LHLEEYDAARRWFPLDHETRGITIRFALQLRDRIDPAYFAATLTEALRDDPYNPLFRMVADELAKEKTNAGR
jgi:hypothetical protein